MDKVVLDSDFIIAFMLESEPNHKKSLNFVLESKDVNWYCLNLVKFEVATVLSRKINQSQAIELIESFDWKSTDYIFADEMIETEALKIYRESKKKNISLVDCANLVLAKKIKCKIASFDKFYNDYSVFNKRDK